jgi:hypothetical protein
MPRSPSRSLPLLLVTLLAAPVSARRPARDELIRVITPVARATAPAHPFVNVVVRFKQTRSGASPDPATFRARLGTDVTRLFEPLVEDGTVVGMRAAIDPPLVRLGPAVNRLRVSVRSLPLGGKRGRRRLRDSDRIRFRASEAPNQPPIARALPDADLILPGIPIQFDALQSHDPENDRLLFHWDFGDGASSRDPVATHAYATAADTVVRLEVSDGQANAAADFTLLGGVPCEPGRTAGVLRLDTDATTRERLEFGAVPIGETATRVVTVRNDDRGPASQVNLRLGIAGDGFAADQSSVSLGPGESVPVAITFAPTGAGHRDGTLSVVACASNRQTARTVAHGYGGAAPGSGPTLAASPAFFLDRSVTAILPDGSRREVDTHVATCRDRNGFTTQDFCLLDGDCPSGGTCAQSATCAGGDRAGQPCTVPQDCPRGRCPSYDTLDVPVDLCGDGAGGLYLLSDEGTFTDPAPGLNELSQTVLAVQLDDTAGRVGARLLDRVNSQTQQIACDRLGSGNVYLAEFAAVQTQPSCFRDGIERLVALRKNGSGRVTVLDRIDEAEDLPVCEDYDEVQDLQVTRDGSAAFATLDAGGLYRVWPRPTEIITQELRNPISTFQVHPDGGLLLATARDLGPTGIISLYKVFPEQAARGPLLLSELTPCATYQVPNNRNLLAETRPRRPTIIVSLAADRGSTALDSTVLVSFLSVEEPSGNPALSSRLRPQGTIAFSSPPRSPTCTALGLVNLDILDMLTF